MELTLVLDDPQERVALFGPANRHLKTLRDLLGVQLTARDEKLKLSGANDRVSRAADVVEQLRQVFAAKADVTYDELLAIVASTEGGTPMRSDPAEVPATVLSGRNRLVKAKTPGQQEYLAAIANHDLTICMGPAGTGKTYLATAMAVNMLKAQQMRRIVLVRPAVEAGEKLGYLPGDLEQKINPFLRPLLDALHDMMERDLLRQYMRDEVVQILPLAFMRGRTLNDAVIIMDEAQNCTKAQMLMFLTRMGQNSKMIVTGDQTQIDLEKPGQSGLIDAVRRLRRIKGVAVVELTGEDIVRHPLVQRVVTAYAEDGIEPMS